MYKILTPLGQGGTGQVFKARQKTDGQEVAIKVLQLRRDVGAPPVAKQIARFQREMQLCARLKHPHIVPLLDSGQVQEDLLYAVFKFIPGQTLKDTLAQETSLSTAEALAVMTQVLSALNCAHEQEIVHRDIKPANIMLTGMDGQRSAVVLDFGLGTVINSRAAEATRLTAAGELLGTPAYAAPEQLRGEICTPGSDLYAWGLVFLECLCGRNPMYADTLQQILLKQLGPDPVPIPHKLQQHVLAEVLQLVLHKDVQQRKVTALTLIQQLQRIGYELAKNSLIQAPEQTTIGSAASSVVTAAAPASDIGTILAQLGLQRYLQLFTANDIDTEVLPELTETDMENLGLSLGARKKLLRFLQAPDTPVNGAESADAAAVKAAVAEPQQRQLTILAVDLADTVISDPEELAMIRQQFSVYCAELAAQHNGVLMPAMGSAWLICYGYPLASEHSAEQAFRTAVALINHDNAAGLNGSISVGIASGTVLLRPASDVSKAVFDLVGEIPILAQQLQLQAPAKAIYLTEQCRRLLSAAHHYHDLGVHHLPGFSETVRMWRAAAEPDSAEQAPAAALPPLLTALVGRENELAVLLQHWQLAVHGAAQVVLLSGEAGIGKSRLIQVLQQRLQDPAMLMLSCFCSPYHQNSALHPLIGLLQRFLTLNRNQSASAQLQQLRTRLGRVLDKRLSDEMLVLFAELLAVPVTGQLPALALSPQTRKQRILDSLVMFLTHLAQQQPVLLIVEDLHWLDPTSQELLAQLLAQLAAQTSHTSMLLLLTARPEFEPFWSASYPNASMVLQRLERHQSAELIRQVAAQKTLPEAVIQRLLNKTDGIPLFIEELTKTALESGILQEQEDHYVLIGNLPKADIPGTLQDSITARLDWLQRADRELLQIGAVLGRQFNQTVLVRVASIKQSAAEAALQRLIQAGAYFSAWYRSRHVLFI